MEKDDGWKKRTSTDTTILHEAEVGSESAVGGGKVVLLDALQVVEVHGEAGEAVVLREGGGGGWMSGWLGRKNSRQNR